MVSKEKSKEERKDTIRERRKRKLQLFVQLLSSGCRLTGACVCACRSWLCPWQRLDSSFLSPPRRFEDSEWIRCECLLHKPGVMQQQRACHSFTWMMPTVPSSVSLHLWIFIWTNAINAIVSHSVMIGHFSLLLDLASLGQILGDINQIDLSKPYFVIYADKLYQPLHTNLARCCFIIHAGTLVCCVVWFIVHWPLIVFQKVNSASTKAAMFARASWALNLSTSHDVQWSH